MKMNVLCPGQHRAGTIDFFIVLAILAMLQACSSKSEKVKDSDTTEVAAVDDHADNDIVMTVRSIIDAINVGQPLNEKDYDFTGILTDGVGRPLYTDVQGTPGLWEVKVLTENSAVIQNVYLGDLLPDDLVQYILTNAGIEDTPMVEATDEKGKNEDNLTIYKTGQCDFIVEKQTAKAPNGSEGPLVKIVIRKSELSPENQTDTIANTKTKHRSKK